MIDSKQVKRLNTIQFQEHIDVKRITVDEKLADDLFRFEVCTLKPGVKKFFDERGIWGDQQENLVRKRSYKRKLGIPQSWNTLKEGQVFLFGEFEIVGKRSEPEYFKISPGRKEFIRIDNKRKFRDKTKRTYSDLLTGKY